MNSEIPISNLSPIIPSKTSDLINDSGFLTSSTGVSGIKGNAETGYRKGEVNLTPAHIGAVNKLGDTITGALTVEANIIQPNGYILGENANSITHAIKLGHHGDDQLNFYEYGGIFNFYQSQSGVNTLLFQLNGKSNTSAAPLPITSGGTGATSSDGAKNALHINRYLGNCEKSVIDYIKDCYNNGETCGYFAINGASYSGAPDSTNYFFITFFIAPSIGNSVSLLALQYGGTDMYVG